jgi:hypothetical protein
LVLQLLLLALHLRELGAELVDLRRLARRRALRRRLARPAALHVGRDAHHLGREQLGLLLLLGVAPLERLVGLAQREHLVHQLARVTRRRGGGAPRRARARTLGPGFARPSGIAHAQAVLPLEAGVRLASCARLAALACALNTARGDLKLIGYSCTDFE